MAKWPVDWVSVDILWLWRVPVTVSGEEGFPQRWPRGGRGSVALRQDKAFKHTSPCPVHMPGEAFLCLSLGEPAQRLKQVLIAYSAASGLSPPFPGMIAPCFPCSFKQMYPTLRKPTIWILDFQKNNNNKKNTLKECPLALIRIPLNMKIIDI